MANEYVTAEEIKAAISLDSEDDIDDDVIELAATAASRAVEKHCRGRRFWVDTTAKARLFDGWGGRILWLKPDLAELTTLKVDTADNGTFDETWTAGADFNLYPLNASEDDEPYRYIELRESSGRVFPSGGARIQVTGKWGWPAVPAEVTQAALLVAIRLVKRTKDAPFGVAPISVMEGTGVRLLAQMDVDGQVMLRRFRWAPEVA